MHFITSIALFSALATSTMAQVTTINLSQKYNKIVVAHFAFMILTFLVLVPAAILIARFGRTYFEWFKYHRMIQLFALLTFIIAFSLGFTAAYPNPTSEQTHYQVGIAVIVLFFVQIALGFGTHSLFQKSGKRIIGYIHAPLGLLIFGLAVWNMETGWNIWQSGYLAGKAPRDVIYAWAGLLVLLYIIGLSFIPREIKQHRSRKETGEKVYVSRKGNSVENPTTSQSNTS